MPGPRYRIISLIATVFSLLSPWIFTVTWPAFSSTVTTVASEVVPLFETFTLSPALTCGLAEAIGSGVWTGTGVGEAVTLAALDALLAFELVSVGVCSHAAALKDKSNAAKTVLFMICLLFAILISHFGSLRRKPQFAGEWLKTAKHFMNSERIFRQRHLSADFTDLNSLGMGRPGCI